MSNKVINLFGNKAIPNTEVKYSELLEKFMSPFAKEFSEMEYLEDIFDFAINSWNFGNMKLLMPAKEYEQVSKMFNDEDINSDLLNKMIDHKTNKFKDYTNFIVDFELEETDDDPILRVVTQLQKDYLEGMIEASENGVGSEDFEENYINRNAIVLTPLQPFVDWLEKLYPGENIEEDIKESNIYLINEDIDDVEVWLKKKFDKFFQLELSDWHTNKKEWPQRRNFKMFKLWFRVGTSTMIYDMESTPVTKYE